jgi:ATP-binding cassette, subfamily B, bacterial PglK
MLKSFWLHLSKRRQKQFLMLLLLILLSSFAEVISIGAILPFLGVLTAPDQVYQHYLVQPVVSFLNIEQPKDLILPVTLIFILVVLASNLIRLTMLYTMTRLSHGAGADISINIYRKTLHQNYLVHSSRNSSEVIDGITQKTNTAISVITSLLMMITSIIILLGIIIVLFQINAQVASIAIVAFGVTYWAIIRFTRNQLKKNSNTIAKQSSLRIKVLQEGLGGIRDILLNRSQEFYSNTYKKSDITFRKAIGDNVFISTAPRYVVEALGMIFIASLAYIMINQDGLDKTVIPVLGAFALGAQKLLPALQQIYGSYSNIKGVKKSFQDVLDLLDQPLPDNIGKLTEKPMEFKKNISLKNISFRYSDDAPFVLNNINLKISKGMRIGFIGFTGSGKSTLLDIIMGLITPKNGTVSIDGTNLTDNNMRFWQAHIAHVPQSIYLTDGTIEENIAFGVTKNNISKARVQRAAKLAKLEELIGTWKDGYKTSVGERGVRLSGGQLQRIGIARALYKGSNVLVFDEATSALDTKTEEEVMKSIEGLGKELTTLIIAHRVTTLKNCDQIIKLEKNGSIEILGYQDIINITNL